MSFFLTFIFVSFYDHRRPYLQIYVIISPSYRPSGDFGLCAGSPAIRLPFEKCLHWCFRRDSRLWDRCLHLSLAWPELFASQNLSNKSTWTSLVRIWPKVLDFCFFLLFLFDSIDATYDLLLQPLRRRLVSWTIMHLVCLQIEQAHSLHVRV